MNKEFCERCGNLQEYIVLDNILFEIKFKNHLVNYIGKMGVCKICGTELFVEEIEEYNQNAFEEACKKLNIL